MKESRPFQILPQPHGTACGPTCLHAVYRYYGDLITLDDVVTETCELKEGGTLAVFLACHALQRGYKATIHTYNLHVFDPTWEKLSQEELALKLKKQAKAKHSPKLSWATNGYLEFFRLGGDLKFQSLTSAMILQFLSQSKPVLTGLSATYLYGCAREYGRAQDYDDIRGVPVGHFVVLCGLNSENQEVLVADPLLENPTEMGLYYGVNIDRLICSILLGVLTYDANLLIIEPKDTVP